MLKLLKLEDKNVIGNSNFNKNAVLYKDLIAFCEAYDSIIKNKNELPNYCFDTDGNLCLEGICFLMKMYATEFKFETMKLTLDYLKILYFAMASFSDENAEVDQVKIEQEFHEYRRAGFDFCSEKREEVENRQANVKEYEKLIQKQSMQAVSMLKMSKLSLIFSVILFAFAIVGIGVSVFALIEKSVKSVLFIASTVCVFMCFVLAFILIIRKKHLINHSSDLTYHVQTMKKELTKKQEEFAELQTKYYRIFCENNEYATCFAELISRFTKVLTFDEILAKAKTYKLISYNVAYDIGRLFKSQQREIDIILSDINSLTFSLEDRNNLSELYLKICEQDWLFYNAEVRYHFLKKFADLSEKELNWKLDINGEQVNPFDVNVRKLSHEKVVYSVDKNKKMVLLDLSDFTKTKYFKNLEDINFKDSFSVESFKKVKSNYLSHFYNVDVFGDKKQVIFDKKSNLAISDKSIQFDGFERIPTLVNLKLKVIESDAGLGNSDTKTIKNIADSIFSEEKQLIQETGLISEQDIDYPRFSAEKTEAVGDAIVYVVGKTKKVGYKLD